MYWTKQGSIFNEKGKPNRDPRQIETISPSEWIGHPLIRYGNFKKIEFPLDQKRTGISERTRQRPVSQFYSRIRGEERRKLSVHDIQGTYRAREWQSRARAPEGVRGGPIKIPSSKQD